MSSATTIRLVEGHHRCTEKPKRKEKIKCTWCKKQMLGNSFSNHVCINPKPKYMSYDVLGVQSIASMWGVSRSSNNEPIPDEVEDQEPMLETEDDEIVPENDPIPNIPHDSNVADEEPCYASITGQKRGRQKSLFEMFSKLKQY